MEWLTNQLLEGGGELTPLNASSFAFFIGLGMPAGPGGPLQTPPKLLSAELPIFLLGKYFNDASKLLHLAVGCSLPNRTARFMREGIDSPGGGLLF